jgi:hypothetical protein
MDAFVTKDAGLAQSVLASDDEVDNPTPHGLRSCKTGGNNRRFDCSPWT